MLSLPAGTEMFHFPALPPPALCVQAGVTGNYALSGFPIRKSPDQCLVADFPGLIAGSNVLLRLLVPRHPPCALINLATKMLASTVQFSRYGRHDDGSPRARPACSARPSGSFGGSICRTLRIRRANTPEGSFRSLRTQQRAYAIAALGSDFHASLRPY